MLHSLFSIRQFWLTKWSFLLHSTTLNASYIHLSHDSILELWRTFPNDPSHDSILELWQTFPNDPSHDSILELWRTFPTELRSEGIYFQMLMKNECRAFRSFWEWPFYTGFNARVQFLYGDLVYKLKRIIGKLYFPDQFKKITIRYKRESWLSSFCLVTVSVLCLFLTVSWGSLQCGIVVSFGHIHLLKWTKWQIYFEFRMFYK